MAIRDSMFRPLLAAGAVFVALASWMRWQQNQQFSAAQAAGRINGSAPPRPIAEVASAIAAMKLVTVEIDTKVKVERGNESWRGDVTAAVEAPVRLSYGTDLSFMDVRSVGFSPAAGAYIICVPYPTCIATQVFSERIAPQVKIGWLRLRSRAGEYYLSQARRELPDAAQRLQLLPADAEKVESTTREQVQKLVKALVGDSTPVIVTFKEDQPRPPLQ